MFGSTPATVEIVGITQGEMSRTVYFHRSDLAKIVGVEATAVLIDLPEGVSADSDLGNVSLVIIEKQDLISSYESILEQQQGFLGSILFLGILIAIVVLFNTCLLYTSPSPRDS